MQVMHSRWQFPAGTESVSRRMVPRALIDDVSRRLFTSYKRRAGAPLLGAEIEMIPVQRETGAVLPVVGGNRAENGGIDSTTLLRSAARRYGWREERSEGTVKWMPTSGGAVSFEPGGQIEFATPPARTVESVIAAMDTTLAPITEAAGECGAELLFTGVEPHNLVDAIALQLSAPRYTRMDAYFSTLGAAGSMMMRQTAALQVNIDFGDDAVGRWLVLNAAAPYLLAIFANSPRYGGEDTGHRSWRAHIWRTLDSARTGVRGKRLDAVDEYARFAFAAPYMMRTGEDGGYHPFGELLDAGSASMTDWRVHLTTLFPEVRPKGYLELRSIDALPPALAPALLVLVAGLVADDASIRATLESLDPAPYLLLERAGQYGMHDPEVAIKANLLAEIALSGYSRAHPGSEGPLEAAMSYVRAYTSSGRSPADDAVRSVSTATAL